LEIFTDEISLQFLIISFGTNFAETRCIPKSPLKLCGMNQWIFQPLLQLLGQPVDDFYGCFSPGQSYVQILMLTVSQTIRHPLKFYFLNV
jgi:hypothetical protein